MVRNASCQCQGERQADVRFPRKSILFPCYVKELSIHVHCVCLAESINKWVERMAVRGGWRPLSGLICEIFNSFGQGNFTFVREKSGKSQGISNTYGCGNHEGVEQHNRSTNGPLMIKFAQIFEISKTFISFRSQVKPMLAVISGSKISAGADLGGGGGGVPPLR